ncbi:MAG: hypothetical protein HUU50_06880 [Candidatus Brocadiae bacterium]|nr:hypothetical protein [Candidatus Brocadiia bacterium]
MDTIPKCFWKSLVPMWIKIALGDANKAELASVLKNLKEQGWQGGELENWKPKKSDADLLKDAQKYIGYIINPGMPEDKRSQYQKKLSGILSQIKQHGREILKIAEEYISLCKQENSFSLSKKIKDANCSHIQKNLPKNTLHSRAKSIYSVSDFPVMPSRLSHFSCKSGVLNIYIDEVEVGTKDGAIAGIVWDGNTPCKSILPIIATHSKNEEYLPTLLACDKAFPFIMPLQHPQGNVYPYKEILVYSLQILLGWLISPRKTTTPVNVYLELYGQYQPGKEWTQYIQGRFDEASACFPNRFADWEINTIEWKEKDYGYIAWGDLLGYWYLAESRGERFGEIHHSQLPGFIPIKTEVLGILKRLEFMEQTGGVQEILDLAVEIHGTKLWESILKDIKIRMEQLPELQDCIIQEMDARYQVKERNLGNLQKMMNALKIVLPQDKANMPLRTQLFCLAVDLQEANHNGDPLSIHQALLSYEEARQKGLDCDRELVGYVDANLAVHYTDLFDFPKAKATIERIAFDPYFEGMSNETQARNWSSLGQQYSIEKQYEKAEEAFQKAIHLYQTAPGLSLSEQKNEIDQTSVYRAINAMDSKSPDALVLLQDVLGDIPTAAQTLSTSIQKAYHHHLLLRALWHLPQELKLKEAETVYFQNISHWQTQPYHPWPLIEMYRALLLWKNNQTAASQKRFQSALAIATAPQHGAILRLIASMIATTAFCCHHEETYRKSAYQYLEKLPSILPSAKETIDSLWQILQTPERARPEEALKTMPFNYR